MEIQKANLGRIRTGQTLPHTQVFEKDIKFVTASCQCTSVNYAGKELSFKIVVPFFSKELLDSYTEEERQAGFDASRQMKVIFMDDTEVLMEFNFIMYDA